MSRYRTVHCMIWNDDKFPFMSDHGKLVFFYLLTNTFSTPFGCYKAGKAAMLEDSRISAKGFAEGFTEGLAKGLAKGLFKYDETLFVVLLPGFLKYNFPTSPNVVKSWAKIFAEIPNCNLKGESFDAISRCCKGKGKAFKEVFKEAFGKDFGKTMRNQEQEQEQEQKHIQEKNEKPVSALTETKKETKVKAPKHQHGSYKNVLLTDAQYGKLAKRFNGTCEKRIEDLSGYMKTKGVKYESHYDVILVWDRKNVARKKEETARANSVSGGRRIR